MRFTIADMVSYVEATSVQHADYSTHPSNQARLDIINDSFVL